MVQFIPNTKKKKVLDASVVAIEKGALGSPSTKVANFTYYSYLLIIIIC